jgi:hypothetical protein
MVNEMLVPVAARFLTSTFDFVIDFSLGWWCLLGLAPRVDSRKPSTYSTAFFSIPRFLRR